jgi:hypothetical protein
MEEAQAFLLLHHRLSLPLPHTHRRTISHPLIDTNLYLYLGAITVLKEKHTTSSSS